MSIPCKMIPLGNSGLPTGYKRLEYIENVNGGDNRDWEGPSASILTDIYPTQNTRGKLVAEAVSTESDATYFAFGCSSGINAKQPFGCFWANRRKTWNACSFSINEISSGDFKTMTNGVAHTLEFSKENLKIDGVVKHTFGDIGEFVSSRELIFLAESPVYVRYRCFRGKAYSFKLWENDVPILDFVPALNPSGVPGMFDTVAKTFKKSATSTQFTAGMTLRQVRDMNLPVPGTVNTLSLSIPCEVYNDSEAWGAIEAAQQKGWTFTFHWTDVVAYLTPQLNAIVGSGNYTISYNYQTSKLNISVNTDVSPVVFMQLQESLAQIVPSGITQTLTWSDGMPADYTRAYYLESTGTQFIKTGLSPDGLNSIVDFASIKIMSGGSGQMAMYLGCYNTGSDNGASRYQIRAIQHADNTQPGEVELTANGTSYNVQKKLTPGTRLTGEINLTEGYISINDVKKTIPADWAYPYPETQVSLFAQNTNPPNNAGGDGQQQWIPTIGRVYSLLANYAGTPAANYVPALNPSGVPGMYDTVSKTFKTNDGTGQFAIGMTLDQVISLKLPVAPAAPDNKLTLSVPGEVMYRYDAQKALNAATANGWELTIQYRDIETPEFQGYVVADYIEKPTGQGTYINTGLSQRLLGYFDYMNTECNQINSYGSSWGINGMQYNNRGSWWVQKSDSKIWLYATNEATCPINTRHTLVHVLCARRLGQSSSQTYVGLGIDGNWSLYFTDWEIPDGVTNTYRIFNTWSTERLYSARFTDIEHKDIASFIPAIDPDGNPCMFDFVRKQPFYNANGSNKFAFTIGLTKEQAESLVLGDKGSGLTVQVPEGTDLEVMQANNPNVTITIQTIPATTN